MVVSDNAEPIVTLEDGTQAAEAPRLKNGVCTSDGRLFEATRRRCSRPSGVEDRRTLTCNRYDNKSRQSPAIVGKNKLIALDSYRQAELTTADGSNCTCRAGLASTRLREAAAASRSLVEAKPAWKPGRGHGGLQKPGRG
ncbi:hypothetical protein Bbelb_087510 [Branchiostoma belcheri]|nr:hypothetical protein Bbelb_087510 [Branchiostoma belcheri]